MSKHRVMRGIAINFNGFMRDLFDLRHAARRYPIDYARTHGSRRKGRHRGKGGH